MEVLHALVAKYIACGFKRSSAPLSLAAIVRQQWITDCGHQVGRRASGLKGVIRSVPEHENDLGSEFRLQAAPAFHVTA